MNPPKTLRRTPAPERDSGGAVLMDRISLVRGPSAGRKTSEVGEMGEQATQTHFPASEAPEHLETAWRSEASFPWDFCVSRAS